MIIQVTMNNYNTTSSLQNEHKTTTESLLRSREKILHNFNALIPSCIP